MPQIEKIKPLNLWHFFLMLNTFLNHLFSNPCLKKKLTQAINCYFVSLYCINHSTTIL